MRRKDQILKDIDAQISNLGYAMVDDDLNKLFPVDVRKTIVTGYKKRIKELKEIKEKLRDLLM